MEALSEFLMEVSILVKLIHPNVVQFLGLWEEEEEKEGKEEDLESGRLWMVMEFMSGGSLLEALRQRPFSLEEKMRAILDACRGMVFLSEKNIVHRDLLSEEKKEGRTKRIWKFVLLPFLTPFLFLLFLFSPLVLVEIFWLGKVEW